LGAIAAGAGEAQENQLADFAWNLGMAFQLVDDILDFTSTEKVLGKPSGNDLREGKVTLPLIYALEVASADERQIVETILADGSYENVPFMLVVKMLERHQSIQRAYERARGFTDKAHSLIASFPESPAQRALRDIVELVTERES
jgi:octaprenyl-diphosphate synthase